MAVNRAKVTVYDHVISAAFQPGGTLFQNVRRIGKINLEAAQHFVPTRTGRLKASLYLAVTPSGRFHARYTVATRVDYAMYTLAGTTGPITGKNGGLLWVRPRPYSWFAYKAGKGFGGRTPVFSVRGQAPNDWLGKSLFVTMKANGL